MYNFTAEDVINAARAAYNGPVCVDLINDALDCDTLDEAVAVILMDTVLWDNRIGNPFNMNKPDRT